MTEHEAIKHISTNLLRISQWYFQDPAANKVICERYLQQSRQLGAQIKSPTAQRYVRNLNELTLAASEPTEKTAERFLTLGVLMQHPANFL